MLSAAHYLITSSCCSHQGTLSKMLAQQSVAEVLFLYVSGLPIPRTVGLAFDPTILAVKLAFWQMLPIWLQCFANCFWTILDFQMVTWLHVQDCSLLWFTRLTTITIIIGFLLLTGTVRPACWNKVPMGEGKLLSSTSTLALSRIGNPYLTLPMIPILSTWFQFFPPNTSGFVWIQWLEAIEWWLFLGQWWLVQRTQEHGFIRWTS